MWFNLIDPNYGARPVKRVIQQNVENALAKGILRGDFKDEDTILVDTELTDFTNGQSPQQMLVFRRLDSYSDSQEADGQETLSPTVWELNSIGFTQYLCKAYSWISHIADDLSFKSQLTSHIIYPLYSFTDDFKVSLALIEINKAPWNPVWYFCVTVNSINLNINIKVVVSMCARTCIWFALG